LESLGKSQTILGTEQDYFSSGRGSGVGPAPNWGKIKGFILFPGEIVEIKS